MNELERLRQQFETLEQQFQLLHDQFKVVGALQMFDRFHAFDGIKDDKCPCCGGRVKVIDNGFNSGLKLEAA